MIVLQTERLTLRQVVPEDLELLAPIFADPEMMRFYPEPFTRERTQRWIDWSLGLYATRGHGLWAMLRRADGHMLGDCGLVPQQIEGVELLEIGYHVRRDAWGLGYATEAALACRDYALSQLGAAQVCRADEARAAYLVALELCRNSVERGAILRRLGGM